MDQGDHPYNPAAGALPSRHEDMAIPFVDATPEAEPPVAAPPPDAPDIEKDAFEIKWFDEDRPPEAGHFFAEASHEPPLQPFEIVHEPKLVAVKAPKPPLPSRSVPPAATRPARPALWIRLIWGFMPIILMLVGYGSVILTQKNIGYAWDEAYYYEPSLKAADWLTDVLRGHQPFSREAIDAAWAGPQGEFGNGYNEHPGLQKILSGIALRAFPDPKMQLWAMRLPIAILFGLTLNLLYLLGRRVWGPVPGLIAALLYATMPRVFGHAHFAGMETPLVFMMLLTVFCFLRGLDYVFWSALTGIVFGLLLATKINGFFLPIPLILWAHLYARHRYVNNLFAMLTLGPLVFVLSWPWLWPDPVMRTLEYLAFHARHQLTAVFFLDQPWGYDNPNAPWYYPWVITGVTLPLTAILLVGWGVLRTLFALTRRPIGALYLMCALTMLLVASAPGTPKYDGERLFLPVFSFLALLGGSGAVGLIGLIERRLERRHAEPHRRQVGRRWAVVTLVALVMLDGGSAIARYYPHLLSYYNPLVGGLRGVSQNDLFETTYWGESLNGDVIGVLNALPQGTSIKPLALHGKCFEHLQLWGVLDPDLLIDKPKRASINGHAVEFYDYHLVQMRQGFFHRPERALIGSKRFLVRAWGIGDVPTIALYKTGLEFEYYWRGLVADR